MGFDEVEPGDEEEESVLRDGDVAFILRADGGTTVFITDEEAPPGSPTAKMLALSSVWDSPSFQALLDNVFKDMS